MNEYEMQGGEPPHVGWWLSLDDAQRLAWRWWDGYYWSYAADANDTRESAAIQACLKRDPRAAIKWCHHWPANARVKRRRPRVVMRRHVQWV